MEGDAPASPLTPRGVEIDPAAGKPFDAPGMAKRLLRTMRAGALSTLDAGTGHPYGSVTNVATMPDGAPVFFMAGLALHTRNVLADPRASLVLANLGQGDALAQPRLTLLGNVLPVPDADIATARRRYLARHPKAELYLSLPDARMFSLAITGLQLSGGPGRNASPLTPADLITDLSGADDLIAAEADAVVHMNADHPPDTLSLYAVHAGGAEGRWRMTGIDPEGFDIARGDDTLRIPFAERVTTANQLRQVLVAMASDIRRPKA